LDQLPEDCTLEDVLYRLYVLQKIEAGLADGEEGRVVSHEQVAAELRRKWGNGAAK
jgi:predicted transcriptional regulator